MYVSNTYVYVCMYIGGAPGTPSSRDGRGGGGGGCGAAAGGGEEYGLDKYDLDRFQVH